MKKGLVAALVLTGLCAITSTGYAYTCNASGCTWQTGYTEPATLTNGQAITDLQSCTATYKVSVDGASPGPSKSFTIAASKPAGGGVIAFNFTDATMVAPHTYAISETVKCTSAAFGTGADTLPSSLSMNNGVTVPPPATGVTLQ